VSKKSLVPIVLPGNPTNPLEAAPKQYVDATAFSGLPANPTWDDIATGTAPGGGSGSGGQNPIGSILMYGGASAPPNYLLCDGAAVSRTTYSALYTLFSTTYGAGDGSTTFNLPDLKGRVAVGVGTGAGLTARARGAKGGEETHLQTLQELRDHVHSTSTTTASGAFGTAGSGGFSYPSGGTANGNVTTAIAGAGVAFNVMQPFIGLNFIVRAL